MWYSMPSWQLMLVLLLCNVIRDVVTTADVNVTAL